MDTRPIHYHCCHGAVQCNIPGVIRFGGSWFCTDHDPCPWRELGKRWRDLTKHERETIIRPGVQILLGDGKRLLVGDMDDSNSDYPEYGGTVEAADIVLRYRVLLTPDQLES